MSPAAAGFLRLELRVMELPLRRPFRHASHERHETRNLWVRASWRGTSGEAHVGWGEGLPRDYVTGETEARALEVFRERGATVAAAGPFALVDGLAQTPALRAALQIALADLEARALGVALTAQLPAGPPPARSTARATVAGNKVRYSAVLSADDPSKLARTAWLYRLAGFRAVKVKVGLGMELDCTRVALARKHFGRRASLRLDANCAWEADEAIATLRALAPFGIESIEEPVAAHDFPAMARVAEATGLPIVLDESLTAVADLERAAAAGVPAIANLRISKLGGLDLTWSAAQVARRLGQGLQLGCQVGETGILSAAGRAFALRCGGDLRHVEGSFDRHLLAEVPTQPDVTFGWGGRGRALAGAGLGVRPRADYSRWQSPVAGGDESGAIVAEGDCTWQPAGSPLNG